MSRALVMLLALMVFGWGTGYKLSLYHPDSLEHTAPAKLSTRASEMVKCAIDLATNPANPDEVTPLDEALVAGAEVLGSFDPRRDWIDPPAKASSPHFSPALYLRPPPAQRRSIV